jgi:hypothetical protein
MASTGNSRSLEITVQKILETRHMEDSDNEDDFCIFTKKMDVSGKDYAFYANYSRRAQESEL